MVKPAFAEAVTCVWWDINRCPVPSNADVRFIGPCIKTKLEKEGYCGPLTINAVGILTEVSHDLLRQVNSSGISLHHVPTDIDGLARDLLKWTWSNPSPANLVLITNEPIFYETENTISRMGYNVNRYFFSRCLWSSVRGAVLSWKQRMAREQDSEVVEVEKWREEGESDLHCSTCSLDIQSFESFMTHLNSKEHALEELEYYPRGVAAARRHAAIRSTRAMYTSIPAESESSIPSATRAPGLCELKEEATARGSNPDPYRCCQCEEEAIMVADLFLNCA
ncbi:hypothetical protein Bca52824_091057 [Brassica carinata]|uniref:NYN domain-containing protein n=1 Tax=Brassica carinata TaxID=52824 RepID=A0A8X7NV95_BRACI|nr:hypothetical protein Bca52824_091057 [Brassica carinata]